MFFVSKFCVGEISDFSTTGLGIEICHLLWRVEVVFHVMAYLFAIAFRHNVYRKTLLVYKVGVRPPVITHPRTPFPHPQNQFLTQNTIPTSEMMTLIGQSIEWMNEEIKNAWGYKLATVSTGRHSHSWSRPTHTDMSYCPHCAWVRGRESDDESARGGGPTMNEQEREGRGSTDRWIITIEGRGRTLTFYTTETVSKHGLNHVSSKF